MTQIWHSPIAADDPRKANTAILNSMAPLPQFFARFDRIRVRRPASRGTRPTERNLAVGLTAVG